MTITNEQVTDLREGDVVQIRMPRWPEGTYLRGPLTRRPNGLHVADELIQWSGGSEKRIAWMLEDGAELTVVSRAPRPLYVNHDRTEPVYGDVAIPVDHDRDDLVTWSCVEWLNAWNPVPDRRWRSTRDDAWFDREEFEGFDLRLLVDGETGQVVP